MSYIFSDLISEMEMVETLPRYSTGFKSLDANLGGLPYGLHCLLGGTGSAKTTFLINSMLNNLDKTQMFFSLEMASDYLGKIIIPQMFSKLNLKISSFDNIINIQKDYEDIKIHCSKELGNLTFYQENFLSDITQEIMKNEEKKPVVYIDYLQLISNSEETTSEKKRLI